MPAKGSSMFGPDVIVGSREYWQKWREKNREKQRLYMKEYHLKQRELETASQMAKAQNRPIKECLDELREKMEAYRAVHAQLIDKGELRPAGAVPFIAETAAEHSVPYNIAKEVMEDDNISMENWSTEMSRRAEMANRLNDILTASPSATASAPPANTIDVDEYFPGYDF